MDLDLEKNAVKYEDHFTSPTGKDPKINGMVLNKSCHKEFCSKLNQSSEGETCRMNEDEQDSDHDVCYTCHSVKAEFSHDHGQHIDNSSVLLHKLSQLFEKQDLCDLQIKVGNKVFQAHRLVLSCASDVFKVMLNNPSWPESRSGHIILKEEDQCIAVFDEFIKYVYTGNIHLTHNTVLSVLMLADKYNVCDLRAVCIEYMVDHLVSTVEHNHSISWLQYAYTCGHRYLIKQCHQFIKWNFHKVVNTKDFLLMDHGILLDLLTSSDLVIPDEFTLFKGVSTWLLHQRNEVFPQSSAQEFYDMALPFLSEIRFPMISPVQLSQLERDPLSKYFTDFFLEKMMIALNFHMGYIKPPDNGMSSHQWQPRNYTNDLWSTPLTIDNFPQLPPHDVRPLLFSSPISAAQSDEHKCYEWNVDLFPKGIHFQKCIMIGLWRNLEVGGMVYNNVRLVLATKEPDVRNVEVAILVKGVQDNVEYFKHVVQRQCIFDKDKQIFHFDDLVPFSELNCVGSNYLCGTDGTSFKILVIIKPVCSVNGLAK